MNHDNDRLHTRVRGAKENSTLGNTGVDDNWTRNIHRHCASDLRIKMFDPRDTPGTPCPRCGNEQPLKYDEFEDVYYCRQCKLMRA